MPWKKAYPAPQVRDLVTAINKVFGVKLQQADVQSALQESASFNDFSRKLQAKARQVRSDKLKTTLTDCGFSI